MNMYNWMEQVIYTENKKPLPIISFPAIQYLYVTVRELVANSNLMAMGMRLVADYYDMPAALGYMDLSVESEAFGAHTVYGADEVPTIIGRLVSDEKDADKLNVPEVGAGRTGVNIEAVKKAKILIQDRPVIAQCTGPFSLAGRLMNVNDIMLHCYESPEMVHTVLRKVTDFIIAYASELKSAGADGIMLAEPLAGLLSPELIKEFSTKYVREFVDTLQDRHFLVMYHNCGSAVAHLMNEIIDTGCFVYHFGDSVAMLKMLETVPRNLLVMGNISPAQVFNGSSSEHVRLETLKLLRTCGKYNNFVLSSGCDIPPKVNLDNVDSFFRAAEGFYYRRSLANMIS